ncbi:MAG: penicillin-insensitive murein endopeptidase [Nannocystaceae bacterium]|nr:penicillin-insensitive murein endopeptidase [bacterium]
MFEVRLTTQDGNSKTEPFRGQSLTLGREASLNDVALDGSAVSSRHCKLDLGPHGVILTDVGSRNGTYVNNERVSAPTPVRPGDRVFIGSVLLEVVPAAAQVQPQARMPTASQISPSGSILRTPGPNREYRDLHGRYLRYAEQWEYEGRPPHLALSADELSRANRWLQRAQPGMLPEVTSLQREFIAASAKVVGGRRLKKVLAIAGGVLAVGGIVTAAVLLWPESAPEPADDEAAAATDGTQDEAEDEGDENAGGFEAIDGPGNGGADEGGDGSSEDNEVGDVDKPIEHLVIPFETLPDVARRYEVSVDDVAQWNFLNPDEPELEDGATLTIKSPKRRPLPQQRIKYTVDKGENTWGKLAKRFDVPVTRLQAYNPETELKSGAEVVIWIDPKPYKPRLPKKPLPQFTVDKRAQSIGKPNAGKLENGIQLPKSPLYIRRTPRLMWGSSQTISNLQQAVAAFRQDVDYDGELILSDISAQHGGYLNPHKSHQAGRDIDIWLPTIKGVYKTKYLKSGSSRPRRPMFDEVDWYALWGLVRALIQTGAVQYVFLDWRYQEFVYRAAVEMGATEEELDEWIQWPRSRKSTKGIFRHSQDHLSHIHVRFLCAPWEPQCSGKAAKP